MRVDGASMGRYAVSEWWLASTQLGIVRSVSDPQRKGRVQVQLPAIDPAGDALLWARVAVPFAGDDYGAFLLPDVDTEVLIAFVAGDALSPVIVGNLWNGATSVPEELPGNAVDRWSFTGKNGTRIAIIEQANGQEKVEISMPSGAVTATLTDAAGGELKLEAAGNTITLAPAGVTIDSPAKVTVNASSVAVSAGMVTVDAGMSSFSGVVRCDTLIATSVVSTSYTPGAGNIW